MATETHADDDPMDGQKLNELVETSLVEGGFTGFRRAAETPTSLAFEAKP